MQVVHHPADGEPAPIAADVRVADSILAKARGLMGRRSIPEDFALVFPFERTTNQLIHMLLVFTAIDVVWVDGGEVTRVETLRPFLGLAGAEADLVVELAPGGAADVAAGDRLVLEEP